MSPVGGDHVFRRHYRRSYKHTRVQNTKCGRPRARRGKPCYRRTMQTI